VKAVEQEADAVWDRTSDTISYVAPVDTCLFVTGADRVEDGQGLLAALEGPSAEPYGSDRVLRVDLRGGREILLRAFPRP
jgi:hypothetical protein